MTVENLKKALAECERFSIAAILLQEEQEGPIGDPRKAQRFDYDPSKKSGAVRRASMDLTRALAELRKS